ncbi:MAG TPA: tryptophan--tRNA ligase, partial [Sphaerochaeta sp.]|nr:tryptophan--tRNA ligase [Sphaerochaeta sp.]
PVGEDQVPHIELSRKIIRKFNKLYGTNITVPRAKVSEVGRLSGLDGNAKMGKSMGNAIYLSDSPEVVWQHVRKAVTDTSRVHAHMEGHPEVCNVYKYHQVFNPEEADEICKGCTSAALSCFACKQRLNEVLNNLLEPMRERRAYYENNIDIVKELIHEGSKKANSIGNENLERIKEKMHILI